MKRCRLCGKTRVGPDGKCAACGARPRSVPQLGRPAVKRPAGRAAAPQAERPAAGGAERPPPEPHATLGLAARFEFASVPGDQTPVVGVLIEVSALGRPIVDRGAGPGAHVILALDLSASMDRPDKFPVLRQAIFGMLRDLQSPDAAKVVLSVVEFSMGARVLARRCEMAVDLGPGVVGGDAFRYRPARVRYPEPAFHGGKTFRADLGTIEAGRSYSMLFEVRPGETGGDVTRLGTVAVRIPSWGGPITRTLDLSLRRTAAGTPFGAMDPEVRTARDILGALEDTDPATALRALHLRRELYERERRDPGLLDILDRAISLLESKGSLDDLTPGDRATLLAHTCTAESADVAEAAR